MKHPRIAALALLALVCLILVALPLMAEERPQPIDPGGMVCCSTNPYQGTLYYGTDFFTAPPLPTRTPLTPVAAHRTPRPTRTPRR